jgi:hypothetical protein
MPHWLSLRLKVLGVTPRNSAVLILLPPWKRKASMMAALSASAKVNGQCGAIRGQAASLPLNRAAGEPTLGPDGLDGGVDEGGGPAGPVASQARRLGGGQLPRLGGMSRFSLRKLFHFVILHSARHLPVGPGQ